LTGSRRNVVYQADTSLNYAVALDESNAEAGWADFLGNGQPDNLMARISVSRPRSSGIQMRYINAVERVTGRKGKFYIGNFAAWLSIEGAFTTIQLSQKDESGAIVSSSLWDVTSKVGEQRFFVTSDTELKDGDSEIVGSVVLPYSAPA
jgi:hypothetical protein